MRFFSTLLALGLGTAALCSDAPLLDHMELTGRHIAPRSIQEAADADDGIFFTERYDNGTEVDIDLLHPDLPPLVTYGLSADSGPVPGRAAHLRAAAAGLLNSDGPGSDNSTTLDRRTGNAACWGYTVAKDGCDIAVAQFKQYLDKHGNEGVRLRSGKGKTHYVHSWSRGVRVYFCLNTKKDTAWTVFKKQLNQGLYGIDHTCRRYKAGYWQFQMKVRLVGKAAADQKICIA